ncbi:MAG: T9SS type A sorting domain-containing protein [Elusimicrobia bacterium]|nr:T9SS type A sorting domain-containing protein [Elusimicrobiota bacterium]
MKKATLIFLLGFLATATAWSCVDVSTATFFNVTSQTLSLNWTSSCSTTTIQYSEIDDDAGFSNPWQQTSFSPPVVFGSTTPLNPDTLYFARISTVSFGEGLPLGSTATLAVNPAVGAESFSQVSSHSFTVHWSSGTDPWNPPGTLYDVDVSSDAGYGFAVRLSTVGLEIPFLNQAADTVYHARVRAVNQLGTATSFVDVGSTRTAPNPFVPAGSSTTVQSPDGAVVVHVPPDTFAEDFILVLSTDPLQAPIAHPDIPTQIDDASIKLENNGEVPRTLVPDVVTEVRAENIAGTLLDTDPTVSVIVTLAYESSDGEKVDVGQGRSLRAPTLAIYRLNETKNLWVRLPTSRVDTTARTVSASATDMGVFALAGHSDTSLETAYAYPVPFRPKRGDRTITFGDLAEQATIRIFSASGRWIQTLEETDGDGELVWDVTDADGDRLSSGVYYFLIESSADKKRGKLVVVGSSDGP